MKALSTRDRSVKVGHGSGRCCRLTDAAAAQFLIVLMMEELCGGVIRVFRVVVGMAEERRG